MEDGVVVRALVSHQCGLGSILARYPMWVESVVGSRLNLLKAFHRVLPIPDQTNMSKFQFDQDRGPASKPAMKADKASPLNIVIY